MRIYNLENGETIERGAKVARNTDRITMLTVRYHRFATSLFFTRRMLIDRSPG